MENIILPIVFLIFFGFIGLITSKKEKKDLKDMPKDELLVWAALISSIDSPMVTEELVKINAEIKRRNNKQGE